MSEVLATAVATADAASRDGRRRLADRIFRLAVGVHLALTLFALLSAFTGFGGSIAGRFELNAETMIRLAIAILFFDGVWAVIWYGLKNLLLRTFVGMSRADRKAVFSSRMSQPFDLPGLLARYSERRIRIVDMIGRRGRFITIALALFYFLYWEIATNHSGNFASAFTGQTLLDSVIVAWLFIALYYRDGFLAATFYGAATRVMDGALSRANVLLILTLWSLFKFTLIPIGAQLQSLYPPEHFAALFAFIWGTYLVVDAFAEIGGSLYGTMKIRVRGIGETNRKSVAGTVTGFVAGLVFSIGVVLVGQLPNVFVFLAVAVSASSTLLELCSPRGTDDFTMATGNALICWAFGSWVLS
jgi:hypothetical protein